VPPPHDAEHEVHEPVTYEYVSGDGGEGGSVVGVLVVVVVVDDDVVVVVRKVVVVVVSFRFDSSLMCTQRNAPTM